MPTDEPRRRGLLAVACAMSAVVIILLGSRAGAALVVSQPLSQPEVIVSLASHEWERLPETARQAALFPRALVLLTLPSSVNKYNCHDCANRVTRLARAGVSPQRVRVLPIPGRGTYGEAQATKQFVESHGVSRVVVVTSAYHTRRSLATFGSVLGPSGVSVGVMPVSGGSPASPGQWWLAAYDRAYVRYEWAAIVYYAARYGVPVWLSVQPENVGAP